MASHSRQVNLNSENGSRNAVDGDEKKNNIDGDEKKNNIDGYRMIDLIIEQLRQAFHRSLDLNRPMAGTIMQEENTLSNDYFEKVENAKGKLPMEMKASQDDEDKTTTLDLNLSLSLPAGVNNPKQDSPSKPSEIKSSASSASTTDERSCMSLDFNRDSPDPATPKEKKTDDEDDGIPSLILMGCSRCMMYVMVSEAEPSCPKCKTTVLIDEFREKPTKRSRRN